MSDVLPNSWDARASRRYLECAVPVAAPWLLVVAGRAGAGKGAVIEDACHSSRDEGGCVVVDPEELAFQHPTFLNGLKAAAPADVAAMRESCRQLAWNIWVRAVEDRKNIAIETRLDDDRILDALAQAGRLGYQRLLIVVVADAEDCDAARRDRVERWRAVHGSTLERSASEDAADLIAFRENLAAILDERLVDDFCAIDREGSVLANGRSSAADSAAILKLFEAPPIPSETPTVEQSFALGGGGRKIKLGQFGGCPPANRPSEGELDASSRPPVRSQVPPPLKVKLGDFSKCDPRPTMALKRIIETVPPAAPRVERVVQTPRWEPKLPEPVVALPVAPAVTALVVNPPQPPQPIAPVPQPASMAAPMQVAKSNQPGAVERRRLLLEKLRRWAYPE